MNKRGKNWVIVDNLDTVCLVCTSRYTLWWHKTCTGMFRWVMLCVCVCRQQREEILRKKEKLELMLKKGKRGEGGVRPESPTGRRKRPTWHRNPTLHFKPRLTQQSHHEVGILKLRGGTSTLVFVGGRCSFYPHSPRIWIHGPLD